MKAVLHPLIIANLLFCTDLRADEPIIVDATLRASNGAWTMSVTLSHEDTGWDDYADGWRIVGEDGTILGIRTLLHPHVDEQPFTRSLSGVEIPADLQSVFIEARTNTDGWGSTRYEVSVQR